MHLAFYAQMFAVPVTGWLMSSAGGYPLPFFGLFEVPDLVATNEFMFRLWIAVHRWLAYALALFLGLHAGAALHHHFSLRDDAAPHAARRLSTPSGCVFEHQGRQLAQRARHRFVGGGNASPRPLLLHRLLQRDLARGQHAVGAVIAQAHAQ